MTIRELLAEESPTLRRRLASLFSGLPDETPASPLSCAAGEVVVRQDAPCRCVSVLVEGRADASGLQPGGPSHTYSEFGPLTLFGEYEALCGANCFLAEVRARTACRFWVLAREDYFSWFFSGRDTTLSRVTLTRLVDDARGVEHFVEELLPECLRLTTDYMNERIRFLVEQSGFFPSSFLVQEGLISADRFLPMFGVTGLAEAVNHLLRDRGLVYGRDGEADALGVRIMEKIDAVVKTLPAAHSPLTGNHFLLHAQVGLDSDVGITSGVRIPVGSEPESFADHLRHCARFHPYFPAGVGDIFPIASNVEQNPAALLDVVKGAFALGVHYMSFYSADTDLVRITGYLVKRSEMEKFRAHQVVLQNTTHLGTANYDVNRLAQRKVRMV